MPKEGATKANSEQRLERLRMTLEFYITEWTPYKEYVL